VSVAPALRQVRRESNAGAMSCWLCREAGRRGGAQPESAEADERRGRFPVGSPPSWARLVVDS